MATKVCSSLVTAIGFSEVREIYLQFMAQEKCLAHL